jgi:hypothetical protein
MTTYTTPTSADELVTALGVPAGLTIVAGSITFTGDISATSLVTDPDPSLTLGSGILLTSGTGIVPTTNTSTSFGTNNGGGTDTDLESIIGMVFDGSTDSNDAATLEFTFTIDDPSVNSISFNVAFGSDEYPEYANSFVDIAAVFVNGANYAYFGGDVEAPLSVLTPNLDYFRDNFDGSLPIEYDGLSDQITIFAPVVQGENTIKIAIADTGDSIYDSGVFLSDLSTSTSDLSGVFVIPDLGDVSGDNTYDSTADGNIAEYIIAGGGNDTILSGAGDDQVDGGTGNEEIDLGEGDDFAIDAIGDTQITGGAGSDVGLTFSGNAQFIETEDDAEGDFFCGGFGMDTFMGGAGDDVLIGDFTEGYGAGDVLEGGSGDDLLEGGAGADTFVFSVNDGNDTIGAIQVDWTDPLASTVDGPDFESGTDKVQLSDFGYASTADAFANVSDVDGVATFADQNTTITFAGLTAADLSADDFILV